MLEKQSYDLETFPSSSMVQRRLIVFPCGIRIGASIQKIFYKLRVLPHDRNLERRFSLEATRARVYGRTVLERNHVVAKLREKRGQSNGGSIIKQRGPVYA